MIPEQNLPLDSVKPALQEQEWFPITLIQSCSQPPLWIAHSLISLI